ncbi:unnamed protein product [Mytilus coruscus]|uniref:Uncharacterized protein n=1 Tax=Mytilus coruscus TaxID=42192 RepID=A0A6J8B6A3_MYTCO|nr:unnamed protein product [Mytilus coruscus]
MCNPNVCFTWKVNENQLTLKCTVNFLKFTVFIVDPFGNTQGDCVPNHPFALCDSYFQNATLMLDLKTNETVYTLKGSIDSRLNGNWKCKHGILRDVAKVEVTVFRPRKKVPDTEYTNHNNRTQSVEKEFNCMQKVVIMATIMYLTSVITFSIIISCVKNKTRIMKYVDDSVLKMLQSLNCARYGKSKSVLVCKITFFVLMTVLYIGLAVLTSWLENEQCGSKWVILIFGGVFGCLAGVLFLNNADSNYTSRNTSNQSSEHELGETELNGLNESTV